MPLFVPAVVQAEPQPKRTLTKYALSYILPSEFKKLIDGSDPKKTLRPPGLDNLIVSDIDRCIIAQGTAEALTELKALIRLLDVKPVTLKLTVKLVKSGETILDLNTTSPNKQKATFTLGEGEAAQGITITPHIHGDGKISFLVTRNQALEIKTMTLGAVTLGEPLTITFGELGELTITATLRP